jgi:hypothetical protein
MIDGSADANELRAMVAIMVAIVKMAALEMVLIMESILLEICFLSEMVVNIVLRGKEGLLN